MPDDAPKLPTRIFAGRLEMDVTGTRRHSWSENPTDGWREYTRTDSLPVWRHRCVSCGNDWFTRDGPDDTRCRGCGRGPLCQSCVDVFEHVENGEHGTGNPAEAVAEMRSALAHYRSSS